jgi:hypothetical protein
VTADQAAGTLRRRQAPAVRGRRLLPVVTLVWAAALAGVALSIVTLTDDSTAPQLPAAPGAERAGGLRAAGDRIGLSFGSASVGGVVRVTGPSAVMGLPVGPGEEVLQAQVTVVNLRRQAIVFPPGQLRLRSRGGLGAVVTATGSSEGGRIEARSPHRFAVRFALATGAPLPRLALRDPGTGRVTVVDLGARSALGTLDLAEHHQPATGGPGR